MSEEEFEHQKALVDMVLGSMDEKTILDWFEIAAEDYWYGLTNGGYLKDLCTVLESKKINTDSIKVMSYVDEQLSVLVN